MAYTPAVGYAADRAPQVFKPGTLLATHGEHSAVSGAIRFGQRLVIEKEYCWANHIACVMTPDGTIMEMLAEGAALDNASKYLARDYVIIDAGLSAQDAVRAVDVWTQIWACHADYGFTEIASIIPSLITGTKFRFFVEGKLICSGAAAVGLCATGAEIPLSWREDPAFVLPAEFTRHWKITPPVSLVAQKGS